MKHQVPNPVEGSSVPDDVLQRRQAAREGPEFRFFPPISPPLMPYLASFDEFGNTVLRPGALFNFVPLDAVVQGGKYWLGEHGLRYAFQQSFTAIGTVSREWGNTRRMEANEKFYQGLLKRYAVTIEQPPAERAKQLAEVRR